jgi:FHS family L-fucose permease-like MFS transporter
MGTTSANKNYTLPIIVMFFLFAMISFVTGFQNPLGVILREQLTLSNLQSQLGNAANFIAYAFMGLPAGMILQKKGYKFSAIAAVLVGLVGVALMFVSSNLEDKSTIFTVYLLGAFVAGFSMCMLNTVVNPMLNTLGGGGKKGNQLLQFGGVSNSLAATICPVLVGYLMGDNLKGCTLVQAQPALYIAMGIFLLAFIVLILSKLPEPILDEIKKGGKKEAQPSVGSVLKFRHFSLGILAIFLYIGVEVGVPNMANLFMTTQSVEAAQATVDQYNLQQSGDATADQAEISAADFDKAQKIVSGEIKPGLNIPAGVAGSLVGMYWFLMLVGRLIGGSLGSSISSRTMLTAASAIALVLILGAIFCDTSTTISMPGFTNMSFAMYEVPINILFLVLIGLCTSIMWGGIFNLAIEGLGKYTAVGSGLFMVMVCGGGIVPLLQGAVADSVSYLASYWVLFAALAYMLLYALIFSHPSKNLPKE